MENFSIIHANKEFVTVQDIYGETAVMTHKEYEQAMKRIRERNDINN